MEANRVDAVGRGASGRARRVRASIRPVFVVCPARCGSTLLRYLLDSHPDVVSPPELNLSALLQHIVDVWVQTNMVLDGAAPVQSPPPRAVYQRARRVADSIMTTVAERANASVYCDKSLTTVDHLATVSRCYPSARYIFLYRYPLDMIASGLEASRWGFNAFGFAPYVAANPGNHVAALGNYWIDRVSKMVEFERTCTVAHARIYYELLCDDPETTLRQLLEFLDLAPDQALMERAFRSRHASGPGDHKIDFTGAVNVASIGRGAALPELLADAQMSRINDLLDQLDYPALVYGWRGDLSSLLGLKSAAGAAPDARDLAASLRTLINGRLPSTTLPVDPSCLPIDVVLHGSRGPAAVVTVSANGVLAVAESREETDVTCNPRVRCLGDSLLRVASGDIEFSDAVHNGLIRVERDSLPAGRQPERPRQLLAALAALLRPDRERAPGRTP